MSLLYKRVSRIPTAVGLLMILAIVATTVFATNTASADPGSAISVDGFVKAPGTGVVEPGYVVGGINYTLDSVSGTFAGLLYEAEDADASGHYYYGFEQAYGVNDNTFGKLNSDPEWGKKGHLKDLLNSEHIKIQLYDPISNDLVLDFFLDYATDANPKGNLNEKPILSFGPIGGDGSFNTSASSGTIDDIHEWGSSLEWNFENNPAASLIDSPAGNANWIAETVWEWSVPKNIFPGGQPRIVITEVHNSPLKSSNNPVPVPLLNLSKTAEVPSGSTVSNGEVITYTINVNNTGSITVADASIEDVIDVNLSNVVPLDGGVYNAGTRTITWSVGDIAPSGSVTVQYEATVAPVVTVPESGLNIYNFAVVKSVTLPTDAQTNTTVHTVLPIAEIDVVKTPDIGDAGQPLDKAVGESVIFTYTVTNTGNVAIENVTLADNQPESPSYVSGDTNGDDILDLDETWIYTASHSVTQSDIESGVIGTNIDGDPGTATVSGDAVNGSGTVTDTDPGGVLLAQSPEITLVKVATPTTYSVVGESILYFYTVQNTGDVTLNNVVLIDDVEGAITLGSTTLAPGASTTGSVSHSVTQDDLDNGSLTNVGIVTGTPPAGVADNVTATDDETVTAVQTPSILVEKTASVASVSNAGDLIDYDYVVTNTGNVTLTGVTLEDNQEGTITLLATTLAPGESTTGTTTRVVSQADIDGDELVNIAVATGTPPVGPDVNDDDTVTVTTPDAPSILVEKTASVASVSNAGDLIDYDYVVTNTGNVTLTGVTLEDNQEGTITLLATTLAPGESTTGTTTRVVSQADIDGDELVNIAVATGTPPVGPDVNDDDTVTVTTPDAPSILVEKTASVASVSNAGDLIDYDYVVTNTGNVTLTGVTLEDNQEGTITLLATTLAPGESTTGTTTRVVSQADIDGDELVNIAVATGTPPVGPDVNDDDTVTVTTPDAPSILVEKTASVASVSNAGDLIDYDYVVTNTGNVTLTGVTLEDNQEGTITLLATTLAPGESTTGTTTRVVSQADIDGDELVNIAVATGTPPVGPDVNDDDTVTVTTPDAPSILVEKTASVASVSNAGDLIDYDYVVTNTGNVTLTGVTLEDNQEGTITLLATTLAPGESTTGTTTRVVSQADIDGDELVNIAVATGTPPVGPAVNDDDTVTVTTPDAPSIQVVKLATPSSGAVVGDEILYTFTVTNTGNVTLTDVTVVDDVEGAITPLGTTTLAPGESTSGMATHVVTQADVDAGSLTNVGTATGTPPVGPNVEDDDTQTVTFVNLGLTKTSVVTRKAELVAFTNSATVSASNGSSASDSDETAELEVVVYSVIVYTMTVTNDGDADAENVLLTDTLPAGVTVTDISDSGSQLLNTVSWDLGTIAAGASVSVTLTVQTN